MRLAIVVHLPLLLLLGCQVRTMGPQDLVADAYTNRLVSATSPYLLDQAHQPVDWYPWGEAALDRARREGKLILISIGYASCHWCHVMDDEVFEDTVVAAYMADHFVSIKVDREERPDVDAICLEACRLIQGGSCGWPLQAIALPDGRPVFAGTYYSAGEWLRLLETHERLYRETPELLEEIASGIEAGVQADDSVRTRGIPQSIRPAEVQALFEAFIPEMDLQKGGRIGAPKFPMPVYHDFLLRYYHLTGEPMALLATERSLRKMAFGGIYDQIGGGFARYSIDEQWRIPHFEKMLYDNAQLSALYARAFQLTRDPFYEQIAYEVLGFIERDLKGEAGGYYASLDSDSEGEEGRYYTWPRIDLDVVLGAQAELFSRYYNVTQEGNWQRGQNILYRRFADEEMAKAYNLDVMTFREQLTQAREKVFMARTQRVLPRRDDKQIIGWNALMLSAFVDAYRVFGEVHFREEALQVAAFLEACTQAEDRLPRYYRRGETYGEGFLDDYALTIAAFMDLYELTYQPHWLERARALTVHVFTHFFDYGTGLFYCSILEPAPYFRRHDLADEVIPSANAVMCGNLLRLGDYLDKPDYAQRGRDMLQRVRSQVQQDPIYFSRWASLIASEAYPAPKVRIEGPEAHRWREQLDYYFLPGLRIEGSLQVASRPAAGTRLWLEQNHLPAEELGSVEAALARLREGRILRSRP
ncbi:MAG: thioredoxin domain-containing protein [Bacteroidetes bacterium]|nr:MAG: thioredoxin domain-containing protein [Bacteroidota bacterium]